MNEVLGDLVTRFTGDASSYLASVRQAQSATSQMAGSAQESAASLQDFGTQLQGWGSTTIGILAQLGVSLSALAVASKGIQLAAEAEQMQIAFETMTGSVEVASQTLADIKKFAIETPFESPELISASKQLLAYGTDAQDVVGTLRMLGDVASGLSIPIGQLVYVYGTLRAQGRAYSRDIRQFATRGIPIYESLAQVLGVGKGAIHELVKEGKVGFPQVQKAFEAMTGVGGRFHDLTARQSKSLGGLFSTLRDEITAATRSIGEDLVTQFNLKEVTKQAIEAAHGVGAFLNSIPPLAKTAAAAVGGIGVTLGGISASWLIAGPLLIGTWRNMVQILAAGEMAVNALGTAWGVLTYSLTTATTTMTMSPGMALLTTAGPYLAVAAALAAIGYGIYQAAGGAEAMKSFNDELAKMKVLGSMSIGNLTTDLERTRDHVRASSDEAKKSELPGLLEKAKAEAAGAKDSLKSLQAAMSDKAVYGGIQGLFHVIEDMIPGHSSTAGYQAAADEAKAKTEQWTNQVKYLQEELRKAMKPPDENDELKGHIDKLTKKYQEQIATIGMSKEQVEIWKLTQEGATGAMLANVSALGAQADELTRVHKKQEEVKKSANSFIESLTAEVTTFGLSSEEAKLYKLRMEGASDAQLNQARALLDTKAALEAEKGVMKRAADIVKESTPPWAKYQDEVGELQMLLSQGALTQEEYGYALEATQKRFDATQGKVQKATAEVQKFDAALVGSAEALFRVNAYQEKMAADMGLGGFLDEALPMVVGGKGGRRRGKNPYGYDPIPLANVPVRPDIGWHPDTTEWPAQPTPFAPTMSTPAPVQQAGADRRAEEMAQALWQIAGNTAELLRQPSVTIRPAGLR